MSDTEIAILAAGSALLGSLVGVLGNVGLEFLRSSQAHRQRLADRRADAIATFIAAAEEWALYEALAVNAHDDAEIWVHLESLGFRYREVASKLELLCNQSTLDWLRGPHKAAQEALTDAMAAGDKTSAWQARNAFIETLTDALPMFRRETRRLR